MLDFERTTMLYTVLDLPQLPAVGPVFPPSHLSDTGIILGTCNEAVQRHVQSAHNVVGEFRAHI